MPRQSTALSSLLSPQGETEVDRLLRLVGNVTRNMLAKCVALEEADSKRRRYNGQAAGGSGGAQGGGSNFPNRSVPPQKDVSGAVSELFNQIGQLRKDMRTGSGGGRGEALVGTRVAQIKQSHLHVPQIRGGTGDRPMGALNGSSDGTPSGTVADRAARAGMRATARSRKTPFQGEVKLPNSPCFRRFNGYLFQTLLHRGPQSATRGSAPNTNHHSHIDHMSEKKTHALEEVWDKT